jgi:GTP-binding protein EngB required for normal cell division
MARYLKYLKNLTPTIHKRHFKKKNVVFFPFPLDLLRRGQCPVEDLRKPEFAFFGQSNVGKSSMLNFLCSRELRDGGFEQISGPCRCPKNGPK